MHQQNITKRSLRVVATLEPHIVIVRSPFWNINVEEINTKGYFSTQLMQHLEFGNVPQVVLKLNDNCYLSRLLSKCLGVLHVWGAWCMDDPLLFHDGLAHGMWLTLRLLDLVWILMWHSSWSIRDIDNLLTFFST